MPFNCDIIVIGAGIAGAGIAAELSSDRRVLLLEQEEHPGIHATGRSAALHSEIYGNACIQALTRASRETFLAGIDGQPFVTQRGCIHIATEQQVQRLEAFAAQPSVSSSIDRLSGDEVHALVPVLRPDTVVAALAERHAYGLDVDAIHREFLRRVRVNGSELRCVNGVSRCIFDGQMWIVIAADRELRAPVLVNAAGAWGDVVAQLSGVRPIGLEPRRRSALLVDPPTDVDPSPWPAVIDIDEQFYFKPEAGKILMSPADETPADPCDAQPEELDLAIAVDRVQQVADIPVRRISHSWAGLRTFVADKTPVAGFDPDAPAFFWLVGQGGYGIQTSPALSRMAASLIRNEPLPEDLAREGVRPDALSPARLRPSRRPASFPLHPQAALPSA